ncbi:DUF3052 family protein [Baekduia soli]|nr:DUF3052 family protein [Baekduia soli]
MSTSPTGPGLAYSVTPLVRKLGFAPGMRAVLLDAPEGFEALVGPLPEGVTVARRLGPGEDLVMAFVTSRAVLARRVVALRRAIAPAGMAWIAWPKRASGVATDVTEDVVREVALPAGLVDVKVCAIDATWSGLKLVVRRELR